MNSKHGKIDIKPACRGVLQKSALRSFFLDCSVRSYMADNLLRPLAMYEDKPATVLQVAFIGSDSDISRGKYMFELIFNSELCETNEE